MNDEEDDGFDLTPEQRELVRRLQEERAAGRNPSRIDETVRQRRKSAAKSLEVTEKTVAKIFIEENHRRLRYNHNLKSWFIWGRDYWREDGLQRVLADTLVLCQTFQDYPRTQTLRFAEAVERAARAHESLASQSEDWDTDPMMLGTPGGVVDLISGALRPGLPEDMISKLAAVAPAATQDCPKWLKFLDEAFEGKTENIAFFQRFCGYSLTGSTREEMILFIAGKPGTGKGTATKTIVSILRDYSMSVPPTMFTDAKWRQLEYYRAALVGTRFVLSSEPEKGAVWSDAFVNELTGGDRISARVPGGKPFHYTPTFKLAFQGEQVPDLKAVSTGLKRRLGLLHFNHAPDKPDVNLKQDLKTEYPGILRWMIDGCLEWQKTGLAPPQDVKAAVEEYFENQDVVARWIDECCMLVPTASTQPKHLLASYNSWAENNFEDRMSYRTFMPVIKHRFRMWPTNGVNYVHGIQTRQQDARRFEPED